MVFFTQSPSLSGISEVTITTVKGEPVYYNTFVTNTISDKNVGNLGVFGRTQRKTENENNNILKTKGYHLMNLMIEGLELKLEQGERKNKNVQSDILI